jgi:hypothetical protein
MNNKKLFVGGNMNIAKLGMFVGLARVGDTKVVPPLSPWLPRADKSVKVWSIVIISVIVFSGILQLLSTPTACNMIWQLWYPR